MGERVIDSRTTKPINEARYLVAENCWRYRPIMRLFYRSHEQLRYWLYKEDVFEALQHDSLFTGYTIEQCELDLQALVQWGNLVPVQDTSRARTIEEFRNKQFRYQMTEYSVEIERMTVLLENLRVEGASLEPTLIERLRDELRKLPTLQEADTRTVGSWWQNLSSDFKTVNRNYQDYIRSFHSARAEELMRSSAFLAYKDSIIRYLREFVSELQMHSYSIEELLLSTSASTVEAVLKKVLAYELSVPRLEPVDASELAESIWGRWHSIELWFMGTRGRESEVMRLLDITNELVRRITRYAAQIIEDRNTAANRKEDYKHLCRMFLSCDGIDDCHILSSLVFGVPRPRHIKGSFERMTDSVNSPVHAEPPFEVEIRPQVRSYRGRQTVSPIRDRGQEKLQIYEEYVQRSREAALVVKELTQSGEIDFASLPRVSGHTRTILLRWVSRALVSPDGTSHTEGGIEYSIIHPEDGRRCVLRCEDGDLEMPAFKLRFRGSWEI